MHNLDKAREWAERWSEDDPLILADAKAAIKLIKELPDKWVDAEKVREALDSYLSNCTRGTVGHYIAEEIARDLEPLLPPKLPTLADMTPEEREACQWMQADVKLDISGATVRRVIAHPGSADMNVSVWAPCGGSNFVDAESVTPLPDLPKLQWPGDGVVDYEIVDESLDDQAVAKDVCNSEPNTSETPKSSIKPEDVPPNEPWLIEVYGQKAIGARYQGDVFAPWSAAALDGAFAGEYTDREVTLIHKLVPETHTLPEGMRLADHKTYGRVVVAPRANTHGEESFYRRNEDISWGASHGYRPTGEFNFLDGADNG
ncbi:hypothetical protein [Corynebacterium glutamicum]|uniref:hypothetical protein n=1 Tax=Corynebacterium glutamicum TaxID=1718 RepID=UPI000308623F|nr:hypothetical protein [Corynebacterium glutamicum]